MYRVLIPFALLSTLPISADTAFFTTNLYPLLEKAQCRMCHNDNGVASATRLQFPAEDATPDEITRFGLRLKKLVDPSNPGQSLLLRKPTNRIQHTGGERIHPGSPEEKILKTWVDTLASLPDSPQSQTAGETHAAPILRRLTHSQYNHTVQDLLGDQTRPADQFPNEDYIHGFTNQADGQSISPLLAEAYNRAAEKLARNAFRGGDTRGLVPCKPTGPADSGCRARFIASFGLRAFRRPLTNTELALHNKLFNEEANHAHDFYAGAQVTVEAMLQSPYFLFHLEAGPDGQWRQYGVASRLSYFLWDTMPDEALFHAAGQAQLSPAGIEKQARRLLADQRAHDALEEFLAQWLRFDRMRSAVRDRRLFPEFSAELVNAMTDEVRHLFDHLVWDQGNFMEFFTADYAFVNGELAKVYGLPAPAQEFTKVQFPPESDRAGIVGSGLFLGLTSKPEETSPTERGIFVREHFLCQIVPPPPPGVNTTLPLFQGDKPLTNREKLGIHLTSPQCAACHNLIDPIGFGLEHYDAIGKFRPKQTVTIFPSVEEQQKYHKKPQTHQLDIDVAASVRGIQNSNFQSPKELGSLLASAPACQRCMVKQLFRYAVGRLETSADQPDLDAALEDFQRSGFHYQNLVLSIIRSRPFLAGLEP